MKGKGLFSATRKAWKRRQNEMGRREAGFFRTRSSPTAPQKQIVITAEKTETFLIRQVSRPILQAFCSACDEEIACLTMEQAVRLTGLRARQLFQLVESGEIHAFETVEGFLLLCPNSVASFVRLSGSSKN